MWNLRHWTGVTAFMSIVVLIDKGACQSKVSDQSKPKGQNWRNWRAENWSGAGGNAGNSAGIPNWEQMGIPNGQSWQQWWADNSGGFGGKAGNSAGIPNWEQMGKPKGQSWQNWWAENSGGSGGKAGKKAGKTSNKFMSSGMNLATSQNAAKNDTAQQGSFFDGIANLGTKMAKGVKKDASKSPDVKGNNWFKNWRNNWRQNLNSLPQ